MNAKTRKTRTVAVRGTVERCDLKDRPPFDPYIGRYDPVPTERKEFYLDVCVRLPDGSAVYFKTPSVMRTVASVPGLAIVSYSPKGTAADWMAEVDGDRCVAKPGTPNANKLAPKVKAGDAITVAGRLKEEKVSRAGKPYKTLTHAFRPTDEGLANFPLADRFGF